MCLIRFRNYFSDGNGNELITMTVMTGKFVLRCDGGNGEGSQRDAPSLAARACGSEGSWIISPQSTAVIFNLLYLMAR